MSIQIKPHHFSSYRFFFFVNYKPIFKPRMGSINSNLKYSMERMYRKLPAIPTPIKF